MPRRRGRPGDPAFQHPRLTLLPLRRSPLLHHPTLDLLHELGLDGMAKGFQDLTANPEGNALSHAEWLRLLLEHGAPRRRQRRLDARARTANLRQAASLEDTDCRAMHVPNRTLFVY